jgi:hypothetical protein
MNKYFYLLIIVFATQLFSQTSSKLSIFSQPKGCWVRIDSVLVGKTPLLELELLPGRHIVLVYPPQNGIWNIENQQYSIEVKPGQSKTLQAVFQPQVYINTSPYGAAIYSDTAFIGKTPIYLPFEKVRGKSFTIQKDGYKPQSFIIDTPLPRFFQLEKDKSFIAEKHKPDFLGVIPKQHLKSKFTLLALSVVSHWTAFYLKNIADDNFRNYQRATDQQNIKRYWDQTQKYDRLSDISLGISYASLAGLIYLVVWK